MYAGGQKGFSEIYSYIIDAVFHNEQKSFYYGEKEKIIKNKELSEAMPEARQTPIPRRYMETVLKSHINQAPLQYLQIF